MPRQATQTKGDVVVNTLKKRYFEVLLKENYPHSPTLTEEADNLEAAIRKLSGEPTEHNAT